MDDWGSPLPTRKATPYGDVRFDTALQPRAHRMVETSSDSKILFLNVRILDSTGTEPYTGDVYVEGERIRYVGTVPEVEKLQSDSSVGVIYGNGRTLMSGLGDAHTHLTWNGSALDNLGEIGVEEHTIATAKSAMVYLDSGYTMCYGAASAKDRLDCVIRDAINQGSIPGPRYLANGKEIARRGGELTPGITAFADGPLEMREVIRHHADLGVDQIKLSMSGEEILGDRAAEDCFFDETETAACVDEAHRHGLRVCSHARARDSVAQCVKYGVDIIYHGSYIDEATMDELEKNKHHHIVAPALNWLYATTYEAGPFGYSFNKAEQDGYKKELEIAIKACKEMHQRGITVLPGGDYGFAWTPHGTYARDLEHFVKLLEFTPMEAIIAATSGVGKLFMQEHELGKVLPGYYADMILVDGNPLEDITIFQDHSKLNVIIINGRIHKASPKDFHLSSGALEQPASKPNNNLSNYIAYLDESQSPRIGHLDFDSSMITPLVMLSGAPVTSLYQVIELQNNLVAYGEKISLSNVTVQAPINDRDILAVGKNYVDHAVEFNRSGYDSSDKSDQPTHPVIFTKRSTSIIACGDEIYPHPNFTGTLDYEGEIGVIVGKLGFQVAEKDAMDYVWGFTIINDVTARERQRDHKQFYIGKSPDTFCPMGPVAVPAAQLPKTLRIQTFVNGEKRQEASTNDLIFSIAKLIKTVSEANTIRPGDIIATGTPAGVGFGQSPPKFLKPGDRVEISVTGLGNLQNTIGSSTSENAVVKRVSLESHLADLNLENTAGGAGLLKLGMKQVNVRRIGHGTKTAVFVHGLGASSEYFTPIIRSGDFEDRYTSYIYDLEGHGLTPTNIASTVTIDSLAQDLENVVEYTGASRITIFAHSLGCLIALAFCTRKLSKIDGLVLMGPPPCPLPEASKYAMEKRAAAVREKGMAESGTADAVGDAGTSSTTKMYQPVAYAAVRASLLATSPEGYAKACTALASITSPMEAERLAIPILLMTGDEDKTSPVEVVTALHEKFPNSRMEVLHRTGHWHVYENVDAVNRYIRSFV
ncbi:uncharacterized protein TRUGW13939_00772 [Talaromyces rugulosus]|uniref:Uncharacterized protein n=1 Tax=Talaromyces rugulosus TaxID=121627 RepID=A0A7H8QJ76_TALRU|nr:uncharacterized protein TRUGW13939_00772 [Talaromyces rugulosus]QKX53692.1 hypothetical protein TRUGW13939_00772 [Talaromyces rugulosus]